MVAAKKNDSSVPPRMPPQRKAYGKARIPVPAALFVSVEIELKKIVCEDLNKYYAALEWAITRFHKERMEQVFNNSIFLIREK